MSFLIVCRIFKYSVFKSIKRLHETSEQRPPAHISSFYHLCTSKRVLRWSTKKISRYGKSNLSSKPYCFTKDHCTTNTPAVCAPLMSVPCCLLRKFPRTLRRKGSNMTQSPNATPLPKNLNENELLTVSEPAITNS